MKDIKGELNKDIEILKKIEILEMKSQIKKLS
jgi:hypothetical protein